MFEMLFSVWEFNGEVWFEEEIWSEEEIRVEEVRFEEEIVFEEDTWLEEEIRFRMCKMFIVASFPPINVCTSRNRFKVEYWEGKENDEKEEELLLDDIWAWVKGKGEEFLLLEDNWAEELKVIVKYSLLAW